MPPELQRSEYVLKRDQRKLDVLETFMLERQKAELTAKAAESKREVQRVVSSGKAVVVKAETDLGGHGTALVAKSHVSVGASPTVISKCG